MSYASSIAQINSGAESLEILRSTIAEMEIDSIWDGPAKAKQKSNLDALLTALSTQISNCNTLTSAMALIDQYDSADKSAKLFK